MDHSEIPATILLVDDDNISIIALKRTLRKLGVGNDTLVARDGREALDLLSQSVNGESGVLPPFIVFLDMNMPRMSGAEFLAAVEKRPELSDLTIFAFVGLGFAGQHEAALKNRVTGFVSKDNQHQSLNLALQQASYSAKLLPISHSTSH